MIRDLWGRPFGASSTRPWDVRPAPDRGAGQAATTAAPRVLRPVREGASEVARGARVAPASQVLRPFGAAQAREVGAAEPPRSAAERPPEPFRASGNPDGGERSAPDGAPDGASELAQVRAEVEASKVRLAREASREREAEKLRLVAEMLPVLDDLDRSIAAARHDAAVKGVLVEGLELVRSRLERVLNGYGLERIAAVGQRFDPALHEAIALVGVSDVAQSGLVVDEVERGYRAGDKVVRPARVRVGAMDATG